MNAESILRSRSLGSVAIGLVAVLVAVGIQQGAVRAGNAEWTVLGPLVVAVIGAVLVVFAGWRIAGWRRTPYW